MSISRIIVVSMVWLAALPEARAQNTDASKAPSEGEREQKPDSETEALQVDTTSDDAEAPEPKESPAVEKETRSPSKFEFAAAAKVGATFHTIFNELKPFVTVEIEVGILLLSRHLELDLTAAWAKPPTSHSGSDDRLVGGEYSWDVDQDFLSFGLLARYRFLKTDSLFNVYAALGPRLFLLRSTTSGSSNGEAFGENRQYETRFGGGGAVGGEVNLGPGAILLEIGVNFGNLDGFITGDTSSSTLDTYLGYRFMF